MGPLFRACYSILQVCAIERVLSCGHFSGLKDGTPDGAGGRLYTLSTGNNDNDWIAEGKFLAESQPRLSAENQSALGRCWISLVHVMYIPLVDDRAVCCFVIGFASPNTLTMIGGLHCEQEWKTHDQYKVLDEAGYCGAGADETSFPTVAPSPTNAE